VTILRVKFAPTAGPLAGWRVEYTRADGGVTPAARVLGAASTGHPLPEAPVAGGLASDPTGVPLVRALARVAERNDSDAVRVGEYLFSILFGPDWTNVAAQITRIEVAYAGDAPGHALCGLPWELAREPGAKDYLFRLKGPPQRSLVRVVGGHGAPRVDIKIASPPLVLFVVGSRATDRAVRAGAEFLGILRNVAGLRTHLLTEASVSEVEQAVRDLRPQIVHFVCHGGVDPQKGAYLELTRDKTAASKKGQGAASKADAKVYGEQLVRILTCDGKLPDVVYLNACLTAAGLAYQTTQPLAARLVHDGVALAIGMSGAVEDQACRIFARRWYEAAAEGHGLIESGVLARDYVLMNGKPGTLDWGFVSFLMRGDVLDIRTAPTAHAWLTAAREVHRPPLRPVFLGRWREWRYFDLLLARPQVQANAPELNKERLRQLGVVSQISAELASRIDGMSRRPVMRKLGLTYTCRHLAAYAARNGHLVVFLDANRIAAVRAELDVLRAAQKDADAMMVAVLKHLWLATVDAACDFLTDPATRQPRWRPAAVPAATIGRNAMKRDLTNHIDAAIQGAQSPRLLDWITDLATDVTSLAQQVATDSFARDAVVLIMIDDLHALGTHARRLVRDVLYEGLKDIEAVRVIAGYKVEAGEGTLAKELADWYSQQSTTWQLSLGDFARDEEVDLVHRQNLLNWREDDGSPITPLFPVEGKGDAIGALGSHTLPSDFAEEVPFLIAFLRRGKFLEMVDDEQLLVQLKALPGRP
jgi:hypothetical protein